MCTAECEAEVVVVAAVEQSDDGVLFSITSHTTHHTVITRLDGFVVPESECGLGYQRCPLVCMSESGGLFCPFPVRNGTQNFLALVELEHSSTHAFEMKRQVLIPPVTDCVPLRVFDRGPVASVRYIVPCLDTTSNKPFLYFEQLVLNFADLASSTLIVDERISRQYIPIDGGGVSPLLYQDGDGGDTSCSPPQNVFIKVGSRVAVFRLFDFHNAEFQIAEPIEDCPSTESFERFEPDLLRIECAPTDIAIYEVCGKQRVIERYDTTVNATVFQCSDANVNVHIFGGNLTFAPYDSGDDVTDDVITLPFNDTASAQCVGRQPPILFLARSSGDTYLLELSTGKAHSLAADTCGPYSCLDLRVLETKHGYIVGMFDYSNHSYLVMNLSCPSSPIISHAYYDNPPIVSTLLLSTTTQPCVPCSVEQPTTAPPHSIAGDTTRKPSNVPTSNPPPSVNTAPHLADRGEKTLVGVTAGSVVFVVLAVVMVTLVIIVAVTL